MMCCEGDEDEQDIVALLNSSEELEEDDGTAGAVIDLQEADETSTPVDTATPDATSNEPIFNERSFDEGATVVTQLGSSAAGGIGSRAIAYTLAVAGAAVLL